VGPLGPYRGRLGLAWVIAPLVLGVVLLVSMAILYVRA
jgi:CBS-domain-containing membrane protein